MAHVAAATPSAFEELYRRHRGAVLMQARKLCASRELAEEVRRRLHLAVAQRATATGPALGGVERWLSSIVRNRAIDAWRAPPRARSRGGRRGRRAAARRGRGRRRRRRARAHALAHRRAADGPAPSGLPGVLRRHDPRRDRESAQTPLGTIRGRVRLGLQKLRKGLDETTAQPSGAGLTEDAESRDQRRTICTATVACAPRLNAMAR